MTEVLPTSAHSRRRPLPSSAPPTAPPLPHGSPPRSARSPGLPRPRAHLRRRRPRLPASSASLLQPRPSGAWSRCSLSLRSSGSRKRLRVAPAGGASSGPVRAAEGGRACSGSPNSDMARAGDPGLPGLLPAPSRASAPGHLPLASEPRRQGRKHKSGSAARTSEEEAPLPAPTRLVCLGEPGLPATPATQRGGAPGGRGTEPRGAGPWASRGGAGSPTAGVRAAVRLPRPPLRSRAGSGARFKPGRWGGPTEQERTGWVQLEEEAVEELRPGSSSTARKPAASGLPETVGGGLRTHARELGMRFSVAGSRPQSLVGAVP